jgi:ABC-type lipoprotein export system ATPase subunit
MAGNHSPRVMAMEDIHIIFQPSGLGKTPLLARSSALCTDQRDEFTVERTKITHKPLNHRSNTSETRIETEGKGIGLIQVASQLVADGNLAQFMAFSLSTALRIWSGYKCESFGSRPGTRTRARAPVGSIWGFLV